MRELEEYYDEEINHGRLYPNLDDLVERDFIEKSQLDKRTNQYALSKEGEAVVVNELEWVLSRFVTDDDRAELIHDRLDGQL